jgi:hypothetical protein
MSKNKEIPASDLTELTILRLAAIAVDLRVQLTPERLAKAPSLITVLDACDRVFEELGWGDSASQQQVPRRTGLHSKVSPRTT